MAVDDAVTRRVAERLRAARQRSGLSLSQLGGQEFSRGFLSAVEHGRAGVSLRTLAILADRLGLPVSYFVDEAPLLPPPDSVQLDHAAAALAYSRYLSSQGKIEEALHYATWAADARMAGDTDQIPERRRAVS